MVILNKKIGSNDLSTNGDTKVLVESQLVRTNLAVKQHMFIPTLVMFAELHQMKYHMHQDFTNGNSAINQDKLPNFVGIFSSSAYAWLSRDHF